jgi:hypothetical protein
LAFNNPNLISNLTRGSDRSLLESPLLCGANRSNSAWDGNEEYREDSGVDYQSLGESSGCLASTNASVDPALLDSLFVKQHQRLNTTAGTASVSTSGRVISVDSGASGSLRVGGEAGGSGLGGFDLMVPGEGDPTAALERRLSETNSDAQSAGGTWMGGTASISSPAGRPSSQRVSSSRSTLMTLTHNVVMMELIVFSDRNLLRRDNYFPGDVTISIADWNYFDLNGTAIATYRLEWSDRSGLRSGEGTKRLDEILFLREKISSEFPHVSLGAVPLPPPPPHVQQDRCAIPAIDC